MTIFEHRAFMLDVSRDRVPTRETLEWLVGVLAAAGFNELQLYVEHTFTYTGHDTVWADASPLTHDDMRWLDSVAGAAGVAVVANMNGFGHMGRWLAHDAYRDLAECPDGFDSVFGRGRSEPTCLEPTPENAALAVELARDIGSTVTERRIHIGGDEPFELGDGRSADRVASEGRDNVYLEHLNRIMEPLVAEGRAVMFWADLFRRDPDLIPRLPAGSVPVVWNYEAPSDMGWSGFLPESMLERLGMPDDANLGFVAHARLFIDAGVHFWVAPGAGGWNTILGRNVNAAANIADAAAVGAAHGSPGLLLTEWGDNGHHQPLAVALPSIVRAGHAAVHGSLPPDEDVWTRVDEIADVPGGTGRLLDELGGLGESIGVTMPNGSAVFGAVADAGFPVFGEPDAPGIEAALALLDRAANWFAEAPFTGRGEIIAEEMAAAVGLARIGLRRLAAEHGIEAGGGTPTSADLDAVIAAYRAAWLRSSRPGGLDDSVATIRR
ncbi:MAG: family 20 glycosylhydrolase [Acidimicrobiales bacterium]|nr:family 20 glycosylhydrolase [Acidimicrobiales bacterium]